MPCPLTEPALQLEGYLLSQAFEWADTRAPLRF